MTESRRRIDRIQDPSFLADLEDLPIDELRSRRTMCDDLGVELSYYRRMLHGRMDLLAFEARRRSGEEEQTLLEALPRILSEGAYAAHPGLPERAVPIEIPDIPTPGRRLVDQALESDFLVRLPSMSDEELRDTQAFLAEVEGTVSQQRRAVHDALDRLQQELTRRYREGLADPGELLTGA
ncbi:MAG TPA: hypothetical protein VK960_07240 [Acidimicrobiia bacterium]|nr:hypothetical protein [Acidimicrobiia bacterium]